MTDEHSTNDAERELVRRFLAGSGRQPAGRCPELLELAAYLDGRAEPAEGERIEAHLAACSRCLDALLDSRAAAAEPQPEVGTRLLDRVRALVPGALRRPVPRWRAAAGWAAGAAAVAAMVVAGLRAGAAVRRAELQTGERVVTEVTFGLAKDAAPPDNLLDGIIQYSRGDRHD